MKMISLGDSGEEGLRQVYLHGGRVHVATDKSLITTIVVSSVAVALWDVMKGVGGMNHYMLPAVLGAESGTTPRYAHTAMRDLLEKILAAGAQRHLLRAKIFGGARHTHGEINATIRDLGYRNAEIARELLAKHSIPIIEERLGGTHGRKVVFRTHDGWSQVTDMTRSEVA